MARTNDIRPGDELEGTGGMRVRVRVESIDGDTAQCVLVRSGKPKAFKLATLRSAYKRVCQACRESE